MTQASPIASAAASSPNLEDNGFIHSELDRCAAYLPPIPQILAKIESELSNEWANVSRLSNLIRTDPTLVGAVLKLGNSPLWRGVKQITEVEEAFQRIGKDNLRSVATMLALQQGKIPPTGLMGASMNSFWRHSLLVAAGAVQIARSRTTDHEVLEHVWTAGLLHDLGALIAPLMEPEKWKDIPRRIEAFEPDGENPSLGGLYRETIGIDHARLAGAFAARVWRMPETVTVLTRFWPDPSEVEPPFLAWAVHRADVAAQVLGVCWQPQSTRATGIEALPPESGALSAGDPEFCQACVERHIPLVEALLSF
jgi:HD-like signal output (HDOD) protein